MSRRNYYDLSYSDPEELNDIRGFSNPYEEEESLYEQGLLHNPAIERATTAEVAESVDREIYRGGAYDLSGEFAVAGAVDETALSTAEILELSSLFGPEALIAAGLAVVAYGAYEGIEAGKGRSSRKNTQVYPAPPKAGGSQTNNWASVNHGNTQF